MGKQEMKRDSCCVSKISTSYIGDAFSQRRPSVSSAQQQVNDGGILAFGCMDGSPSILLFITNRPRLLTTDAGNLIVAAGLGVSPNVRQTISENVQMSTRALLRGVYGGAISTAYNHSEEGAEVGKRAAGSGRSGVIWP